MEAGLNLVFHALADPTRRTLLQHLQYHDRTITHLAQHFDMSFAAVSKHLRVLERAGLLSRRVVGRAHHLRANPAPLAAADRWIQTQLPLWTERLNALEDYLEELDEGESTRDAAHPEERP